MGKQQSGLYPLAHIVPDPRPPVYSFHYGSHPFFSHSR